MISGKMDSSDLLSKVVGREYMFPLPHHIIWPPNFPIYTLSSIYQIFLFIPFPLSTKFSYLYPFPYLPNFPIYTLSPIYQIFLFIPFPLSHYFLFMDMSRMSTPKNLWNM